MFVKKILTVFIFLIFAACGFEPIYSNKNIGDLNINILSIEGDENINKNIKNKLSRYTNKEIDNKLTKNFNINVKTTFEKNIIAKDKTGAASDYQLVVNATFDVTYNSKIKKLTFSEKFNYKKMSDNLEEKNYEKIVIENLVSTISEKLTTELSRM